MTDRERILAEPCGCANPGERCLPRTVLIGFHRQRLERAGVPLRDPLPLKYPVSGRRNDPREVRFR